MRTRRSSSIDLERRARLPGVVCGADRRGPQEARSVRCHASLPPNTSRSIRSLAQGKVRFVGEPVAVAVATDSYIAQDALDLIEADYDPLDAVVDPEKALAHGAPIIHDEFGTNLDHRVEVPSPAVEDAMRKADRVIKFRLVNQRLAPIPMEPRGVVAQLGRRRQASDAMVLDPDSASAALATAPRC